MRNSKAVAVMESAFPEDLLEICTQNLVQSWDWDDYSLDGLLSQVSDPKELPEPCHSQPQASSSAAGCSSQFVIKDDDVQEAQQLAVPANTRKQTNWSEHHRKLNVYDCPSHLFFLAKNSWEFNHWLRLCRFVLKVQGKDGNKYPPNTLHQLCCGILCFQEGHLP